MLLLALARPAIPGHRTIVAAHSCTHNASITNITRHTFDLPLPSSTTTYTYHCSASLIILMQYHCFGRLLLPRAARRSLQYTECKGHPDTNFENVRC